MATATSVQYVQKMFIAYLGRGASTEALNYWAGEIDTKGEAGKDALFFDLWNSVEGKALYDGKTQDQIIDQIYQNAFERNAKEAGKTYYKGELASGDLNVVSMAGAIVDSADEAGAQVFDYKNQAADYYRTEIDKAEGQSFDKTESLNAVKDVDGPNSLADSKAYTNAIASGVGGSYTLTTGTDDLTAGTADPAMTAGDDTVTGTVGTGATYANVDIIADTSTTDQDTLTLSGDNGFNAGSITNVEAINLSLGRQNGAAFDINDVSNITGSTINLTVAEKVTIAGIEVDGETEVDLSTGGAANLDALVSNLSTVNVTKVTAKATDTGTNSADIAITGDADLKTVVLTGVDDNDTVITLTNNDSSVSVVGTGAANDSVSVTGVGKVALDLETGGGGGSEVELVTLAGSGGAVTYTVTNALETSATKFTTAGDQAITLKGAAAQFGSAGITHGGTGALGFTLTAGGDLDVSTLTVAGGVSLAADQTAVAKTFTVASGTAVSIDAVQAVGATLTLDANDTATDSALTLNVNERGGIFKTVDFDTVTINTNDSKLISIAQLDMDQNDTDVSVGGSNDVTITGNAVAGGDLSIVGRELKLEGNFTATKGDISITASGGLDADDNATALTAQNDIAVTATNDVDLKTTTSSGVGNVTITGNDIDAADIFDIEDGNLSLTSTGSRIDVEEIDLEDGAVTITSATGFDASSAIAATNDVTITATNEVVLDSTVDTTKGSVALSGNDVTISGATTATIGNVTLTATNDAATSDIDANVTAGGSITISDGKWDADGVKVEAQGGSGIVISGDAQLAGTAGATLEGSSVTITSTSDQKIAMLTEVASTQGIVLSAGTSTGDITVSNADLDAGGVATLVTGSGKDSITINDANVTATITSGGDVDTITLTNVAATGSSINAGDGDDVISVGAITTTLVVNGGAGDDSVTLLGDTTGGTIDMGAGTDDTIVLDTGDYSLSSGPLAMKNVEEVDITAGDVTFDWVQLSGNDTEFELKGDNATDELIIEGGSTGDTIDLTGITSNALAPAAIKVTAGNGINSITGAESLINTITGGTGVDTITGGDGADALDGGNGNDVINGGGGTDAITGGAGADTINGGAAVDTYTTGATDSNPTGTAVSIATSGIDTVSVTNQDQFDFGGTEALSTSGGAAIAIALDDDVDDTTFTELLAAMDAGVNADLANLDAVLYIVTDTGDGGSNSLAGVYLVHATDDTVSDDDSVILITGTGVDANSTISIVNNNVQFNV